MAVPQVRQTECTCEDEDEDEDESECDFVFLKYDPTVGLDADKYAVLPNDTGRIAFLTASSTTASGQGESFPRCS